MDMDKLGAMMSEPPEPITIEKGGRKRSGSAGGGSRKRSNSAGGGKANSAKKRPSTASKMGKALNRKVNITSTKTVKTQGGPQKDLKSWNDNVTSKKYFDINVDKREKRLQENALKKKA